jgi:uncharacterized protein
MNTQTRRPANICPPMKTLAYLAWCAALVAPLFSLAQTAATSRPEPIIDMHQHARKGPLKARDGTLRPALNFAGAPERPPPVYTEPGSILRGTLEKMDQHNIVLAYLSDSDALTDPWVAAAPDRFLRSAAVSGAALPDLSVVREGLAAKRYRAIGEISAQYQGIAPNDPRLAPYFALAEEFDVPVLIHATGLGPAAGFRSAQGRPLLLEDVLVKHRRLRLFMENAGYPYLDETIAIMTQYPDVYADLSTITWVIPRSAFHRYLRALVEAGLGKKLMFGSDQVYWPEAIDWAIDAIESADFLTSQQKRDIFYNNAARFLRLTEAEIARHHGRSE